MSHKTRRTLRYAIDMLLPRIDNYYNHYHTLADGALRGADANLCIYIIYQSVRARPNCRQSTWHKARIIVIISIIPSAFLVRSVQMRKIVWSLTISSHRQNMQMSAYYVYVFCDDKYTDYTNIARE